MDSRNLDHAAAVLQREGFVPHVHPQNQLRHHHFAGSVRQRVDALHSLFLDDSIHGVMAVQGGYGTDHLLDVIDYDLIKTHPKCLVGYSDVTSLLHAVWTKTGLVTFHGPMLHSFVKAQDPFTVRHLHDVLSGRDPRETSVTTTAPEVSVLRGGSGTGRLIGGNLTTLTRLIGTPYEVETAGAILFLEDVDEQLYTLDRMFWHLRQAGKLEGLQGLLIAKFVDTKGSRIGLGRTIEEVVRDACSESTFPIVFGFPCGHGLRQTTLPIGIRAHLDADEHEATLVFEESPVGNGESRISA